MGFGFFAITCPPAACAAPQPPSPPTLGGTANTTPRHSSRSRHTGRTSAGPSPTPDLNQRRRPATRLELPMRRHRNRSHQIASSQSSNEEPDCGEKDTGHTLRRLVHCAPSNGRCRPEPTSPAGECVTGRGTGDHVTIKAATNPARTAKAMTMTAWPSWMRRDSGITGHRPA
jgi:hypothetical protein